MSIYLGGLYNYTTYCINGNISETIFLNDALTFVRATLLVVQITQSNNFYVKSFNFPYSLYYLGAPVLLSFTQFSPPLGPLVLLSPTQFCPSDKYFLTFPPVLLSFPHLYSLADL
jgi:hypothetical protein